MGISSLLCFPPISVNPVNFKKNSEGEGTSYSNHALLAKKGLVFDSSRPGNQALLASAPQTRSVVAGPSEPSRSGQPGSHGLVSERQLLRSKGFSNRLISTLLASRKRVTRAIYSKVWKRYKTWCLSAAQVPGSLVSILEFLQDGADKGLAVSTLKVQVAALTVFLEKSVASDPLVIRFFRALKRSRPAPVKVFPRWDLSVVLQSLTKGPFEPLVEASLRFLTLKTVFLIAIVSARRISELNALSIKEPYLSIFPDRVILRTDAKFLPKVASVQNRIQDIVLPTFCVNPKGNKETSFHTLDVRRTLLSYLERTESFRRSDSLFVLFSGRKKGFQASKVTLARWLKLAISEAYSQAGLSPPAGICAHSTRALASTWAERAGATPEQICKAATWSSFHTFVKHYRLDLTSASDQAFGRKVLQAVVPP
ncbi:uncharacterized protein LOC143997483 [Lithobates pipiens]